jgi:hypothetical protein
MMGIRGAEGRSRKFCHQHADGTINCDGILDEPGWSTGQRILIKLAAALTGNQHYPDHLSAHRPARKQTSYSRCARQRGDNPSTDAGANHERRRPEEEPVQDASAITNKIEIDRFSALRFRSSVHGSTCRGACRRHRVQRLRMKFNRGSCGIRGSPLTARSARWTVRFCSRDGLHRT